MRKINKFLIIPLLLLSLICFNGCSISDYYKIVNGSTQQSNTLVPTSLELSCKELLQVGEQTKISVVLNPTNASNKVEWICSNKTVCSVSNTGVVTALKPGNAIITCVSREDSKVYSSVRITVTNTEIEATALEIVKEDVYYAGETYTFTAQLTPQNARYNVSFSSSDTTILEFSGNKGYFKKAGTVDVACNYLDSENNPTMLTAFVTIEVKEKDIDPQKITLKCYKTIYVSDSVTIDTRVLPEGSKNTFVWTSSDNEVCTVNDKGKVTGIKKGIATIRCTSYAKPDVYSEIEIEVLDTPNMDNIDSLSLQDQIKAVYHYTNRSVFGVINYKHSTQTLEDEKSSIGTGFIYKAFPIKDINGEVYEYVYYLITNRHVVKDSNSLKVYIAEYDKYIDCELLSYDEKVDVAVCKFVYSDYFRPLVLSSEGVETGDFVLAMGNPYSLNFYDSLTLGIVANNRRYYSVDTDGDDVNDWDQLYIQHDAAINPGNSGGPLFNLKGEVVGINTMKLSAVDIDTMGFSIPCESFEPLLEYLEASNPISRPLLGVTISECKNHSNGKLYISETETVTLPRGLDYGMYVISVTENSVSSKAGVMPGDIILSIDGVDLVDSYRIRQILGTFIVGSGQSTFIEVYRNNQILKLEVVF